MPITDQALRNHAQLFPDHVSALAVTDPELIELFENWAFDDVLGERGPDTKTRLMLQLGAIIACNAANEYRVMLGAALNVGVTPVEIKEIDYQDVAYVGMARVFDFLGATNEVFRQRGMALPLQEQLTTNRDTRLDRGMAVQKRIFGSEHVAKMHADATKDQHHIQNFLSANCFGDY